MAQRRKPGSDPRDPHDPEALLELRARDGARKIADLSQAVTGAALGRPEIAGVPKWPSGPTPLAGAAAAIDPQAVEIGSNDVGPVLEAIADPDDPQMSGEALLREASRQTRQATALRRAAERLAVEEAAQLEDLDDSELADVDGLEPPARSLELPGELRSFSRWVGRLSLSLSRAALEGGRFAAGSLSTYVVHHPVHFVFNLTLVAAMLVLLATGGALNDELISLKLTDRTATEIASASRFTRNYSLTDVEKRGTREFMRAGAPQWIQHESIKAVIDGSREAGLSLEHQAVLLATAEIESGFNPMAQAATTTACGIFQFIRSTGAAFGLKNSDCLDPWKSTAAEIAHYKQNYAKRIEERVARVRGPERLLRMFELSYYLHHDGPLSSDPSDELKATVLAGTPFLFKVYDVLKADDELRSLEPTFVDHFKNRFDGVVARARVAPSRVLGPVVAWMRPDEVEPGEDVAGAEATGPAAEAPSGAEDAVAASSAK